MIYGLMKENVERDKYLQRIRIISSVLLLYHALSSLHHIHVG